MRHQLGLGIFDRIREAGFTCGFRDANSCDSVDVREGLIHAGVFHVAVFNCGGRCNVKGKS